jgi:pimeloyl-ACP methyl ester carboxylesterase
MATGRSEIVLHGHRVCFRLEGKGPLVVLLHGIAGSAATWDRVVPLLSASHTVLAPDLIGHGESAKPDGDYSLGGYANGVRDLLVALGHERATLVGHSLGGGVAMQFAYQFAERCERLVLVSSGGLGRELHAVLRAAALPGAELALPWLSAAGKATVARLIHGLGRVGLRAGTDLEEIWRSFVTLGDPEARRAFVRTVRSLIDLGGQRLSAHDRLYLTAGLPTLIVWGERDPLIPVAHAERARDEIEGSRLVVFPGAGHFPYRDDPALFAATLLEFVRSTRPLAVDPGRLRRSLRRSAARSAPPAR